MAIVSTGFVITLSAADQGGNIVNKTFYTDPAVVTDAATCETARAALATLWPTVSELVICGMGCKECFEEDSLTLPTGNVEAENKASITMQLNGTKNKGNIKIPAPVIGIFNGPTGAAANQVDVTDVALQTYLAQWIPATGPFTLSDGQKAQSSTPLVGKRISAKNNNG